MRDSDRRILIYAGFVVFGGRTFMHAAVVVFLQAFVFVIGRVCVEALSLVAATTITLIYRKKKKNMQVNEDMNKLFDYRNI